MTIPSIAKSPAILNRFAEAYAASGVVGEEQAAKLLYLVVTSRLLDRPVSAVVKGPSSAGKSRIVAQVLRFFPEHAYYEWTAMSERALAYDDAPLSHRFIVLYEANSLQNTDSAYLMRSLLSEGQIRYITVEKIRGQLKKRVISRDGPTGLISTTTATILDKELETRYFSIPINDTTAQTRQVMIADALRAAGAAASIDLDPWKEMQEWLTTAYHRVHIPYARELAERASPKAVRMRRDFGKVLTLIQAHAMLHQGNREMQEGTIVATKEDYGVVRELVEELLQEELGMSVSKATHDVVTVIAEGGELTVRDVAERLGLDDSTAWRRVHSAIERGYVENLESRPRRPARLTLGAPLPETATVLPVLEK